jgi:hypothetical protein
MKKFKELKEGSYGDAMSSRLPAHLDDPRVEPKKKVVKKPVVRNPKDHSWKLYRESAALDAALDGITVMITEDLSPARQKSVDAESAQIKENAKKPENQKVHEFKQAHWTHPNGHPRCIRCGDEERTDGMCHPSLTEELTPREKKSGAERLSTPKPPEDYSAELSVKAAFDRRDKERREVLATQGITKGIKETYEMAYDESGGYKVGDRVVPKIGPHKGEVHKVIHVHPTGHVNIQPERHGEGRKNHYHLGAARAHPDQLDRAPVREAFSTFPTGINRQTVQEVFAAAKDKKKVDNLPGDGAKEPNQEVPEKGEPTTQDGGAPGAQKKSNALKPEKSGKSKKMEVKGPGVEDKFQPEPIVTPLTTMPDTASPKSGSQGVR